MHDPLPHITNSHSVHHEHNKTKHQYKAKQDTDHYDSYLTDRHICNAGNIECKINIMDILQLIELILRSACKQDTHCFELNINIWKYIVLGKPIYERIHIK